MTQEEKAKAYDKALEIAKKNYDVAKDLCNSTQIGVECFKNTLTNMFPELTESKEEKIKKWLIGYFNQYIIDDMPQVFSNGLNVKDILAWLEKQGEQKPFDYENANIQQKDFAPKVEPKFNVGDWVVTDKNNVVKIKAVNNGYYYTIDNGMDFNVSYIDKYWHLWTIQDAKNGDILAATMYSGGIWIGIFKEQNGCTFSSYCYINTEGTFRLGAHNHGNGKAIYPATKEQRNTLKKAMADAGYTFDFEKKELKKIKQKPAEWSEEDEDMIQALNVCITTAIKSGMNYIPFDSKSILIGKVKTWLKLLKERVQSLSQSKEWSEEDEKFFKTALWHISYSISNGESTDIHCDTTEWLKSLKDRYTWKPSEH